VPSRRRIAHRLDPTRRDRRGGPHHHGAARALPLTLDNLVKILAGEDLAISPDGPPVYGERVCECVDAVSILCVSNSQFSR
jgi:hypothetical protein